MNIQTARLLIRDLTPADAEGLFTIYANAEVRRFIGGQPTQTIEEQREQLAATLERQSHEQPGYGRWAVERLADGLLVAIVLLKHPPDAEGRPLADVEIGWHLGQFAWGNGYATEAARAILDHARDTLKLPIVYAIVHPENVPSIRVAERLGMKPLGLTKRFYGKEVLHFVWENSNGEHIQRVVPALRVKSFAASMAYYARLGFVQKWVHQFEAGFPLFASIALDGMEINLTEHRGDCQFGGLVHFYVPDVDAFYGRILANGVQAEHPPENSLGPDLRDMSLVDPDGNRLRFLTRSPKKVEDS